jgi:shikimate dehydrogenase
MSGSTLSGGSRVLCVWGHPVAHSRSPQMHNAALAALGLDWVYVPFDVAPVAMAPAVAAVRALGIVGVNVTVPLKELVAAHLDVVDPTAERALSVNTIYHEDGLLYGYSTDGGGLIADWESLGWPTRNQSVYMVGAGGSARAIACALAERGNRIAVANRTPDRADALVAILNEYWPGSAIALALHEPAPEPPTVVVNCTSIGMHPREDELPPLPAELLSSKPRVYDLIYAPPVTRLLGAASAAGCECANGLGMLVRQGALSLSIWTGLPVDGMPISAMERAATGALVG